MPTKRNRADQQQNYVPAGNGDASGEYADHESGSNRHFVNFSKKDEESISVVNSEGDSKSLSNNFDEYIKNTYGETDFGKGIKASFDLGNDDSKNLVDFAVKNGVKINKISGIANYSGAINLAQCDVGEVRTYGSHAPGSTFYHEFWHCFDEIYGSGQVDRITGEITLEKLITNDDKNHVLETTTSSKRKVRGYSFNIEATVNAAIMSRNLSTGKVLSNGKTLYETLQGECKRLSTRKEGYKGWDNIQQDFKNELESMVEEKYPNYKSVAENKNKIENLIEQQLKESGVKGWTEEFYTKKKELLAKDTAYQELAQKQKEIDSYRTTQRTQLLRSWMSISDMYGIHNKVPYGFCGGHTGNYSTKIKGAIAMEFVAEFGSALSRKDKYAEKELELFRKYFPETSKSCEELCNMVIEHSKRSRK